MIFYTNTLALLIYVIFIVFFFKNYNRYLIFNFQLIFANSWMLISIYYHDSIVFYNWETKVTTYETFTTSIVAMILLSFLFGTFVTFSVLRKVSFKSRDYKVFIPFYAIVICILFIVIYNDFIILNYLDYEKSVIFSMNPMFNLVGYYAIFSFLLGIGFYYYNYKVLSLSIICFMIFFGFLHGAKFTYFMEIILPFFMPLIIKKKIILVFKLNFFLYLLFTVIIFLMFTLYKYSYYDLNNIEYAIEILMFRLFAGQGGLAWSVISLDIHNLQHFSVEINKVWNPTVDTNLVGLKYLMHLINIPEDVFKRGYLLTMGFEAGLFYMFGIVLSLLFSFLFGILNALNIIYIYISTRKLHFIRAVIAFSILISLQALFFTGNYFVFFTTGLLVKILIIFILESYSNQTQARMERN